MRLGESTYVGLVIVHVVGGVVYSLVHRSIIFQRAWEQDYMFWRDAIHNFVPMSSHSCLPATRVCPHIWCGVSCWASEGGVVSYWDHTGDCKGATWTWCQWLLPCQREWDQTRLLLPVTKTPRRCCTLPCWEKRFWSLRSSWNSQGLYDSSQSDWLLQTPSYLRGPTPPAHISMLQSHPCWWVEIETLHMASMHIYQFQKIIWSPFLCHSGGHAPSSPLSNHHPSSSCPPTPRTFRKTHYQHH